MRSRTQRTHSPSNAPTDSRRVYRTIEQSTPKGKVKPSNEGERMKQEREREKNRNLRQVYTPSGDYVRNRKIAVTPPTRKAR
jgi:hypothetical protein